MPLTREKYSVLIGQQAILRVFVNIRFY